MMDRPAWKADAYPGARFGSIVPVFITDMSSYYRGLQRLESIECEAIACLNSASDVHYYHQHYIVFRMVSARKRGKACFDGM